MYPAKRIVEPFVALPDEQSSFHDRFVALFDSHFPKLFRLVNRTSGDAELAKDVVQEAFVRLYRRGEWPDAAEAWLVTVALNLMRNEKSTRARRLRLLTPARAERVLADAPASPEQHAIAQGERARVRQTLDGLAERERRLLLLRSEGYSYRDMARVLGIHEASVGVLLARARRSFRERYGESS